MNNTIQQAKPSTVTNAKRLRSNDTVLKLLLLWPKFIAIGY